MLFRSAITQGTYSGLTQGIYNRLGVLVSDAKAVLARPSLSASTDEEIGARDGLLALGLVRRRWWGRYELTDAGRAALSEDKEQG